MITLACLMAAPIPLEEVVKGDGVGKYGVKKDEELFRKLVAAQQQFKVGSFVTASQLELNSAQEILQAGGMNSNGCACICVLVVTKWCQSICLRPHQHPTETFLTSESGRC